MNRAIPTANWFVCWPCREYFKTRKCFENHKLTEHEGKPENRSHNPWSSPSQQNSNVDSSSDPHSVYGPHEDVDFNDAGSTGNDSGNLSDGSLEDGAVSDCDEKEEGKKTRKILSVDWLVCRPCREYFKSAKSYDHHQLHIHGVRAEIKEEIQSSWTPVEVNSMVILENGPMVTSKLDDVNIESGENCSRSSSSLDLKLPLIINAEETFPCSICSKRFRLRFQLNCHIRTHIGEKPFACSVCGKGFTQEDQLRTHREKHTRRKYKRRAKPKHFENSYNFQKVNQLIRSAATSKKKKSLNCTICYKVFSSRQHLLRHEALHDDGERRRFPCSICGKGFNFKHNLVRHEATHTGERPFECEICGKFFTQKHNVYRHIRQMHSIDPITNESVTPQNLKYGDFSDCDLCGKVFSSKHNMLRHQRKTHGQ